MKLTLRVLVLFVLVLAAAAIASADGVPLTLTGATDSMGGVYVGPYTFTTSNGQTLQLVCDDFKDDVTFGQHWTATTTTVSSLSGVMFTGPNASQQYQEVAWLVGQMLMPANIGSAENVGDIQWAIWNIFDPGIGISPSNPDPWGTLSQTDQSNIGSWLSQAQSACGNSNNPCTYPNFTIYTPPLTGLGQPQEYFGMIPTPEPSSLALLVSGMLALMLLVIRRGRA